MHFPLLFLHLLSSLIAVMDNIKKSKNVANKWRTAASFGLDTVAPKLLGALVSDVK